MLLDLTTTMNFSDWSDFIKNILEGVAILVVGGWAFYRFGLFREKFPSIEIENGVNYLGENEKEYLLELNCIIENKGKVRKWLVPLDFYFSCHRRGEPFEKSSNMNDEVWFQNQIPSEVRTYWVSPTWYIPFVDGASKRQFYYLTSIPKDADFVYLQTRFFDFNDKTKAIDFILQGKDKIRYEYSLGRDEQIKKNLEHKNDIYIARKYISVASLKKLHTTEEK